MCSIRPRESPQQFLRSALDRAQSGVAALANERRRSQTHWQSDRCNSSATHDMLWPTRRSALRANRDDKAAIELFSLAMRWQAGLRAAGRGRKSVGGLTITNGDRMPHVDARRKQPRPEQHCGNNAKPRDDRHLPHASAVEILGCRAACKTSISRATRIAAWV